MKTKLFYLYQGLTTILYITQLLFSCRKFVTISPPTTQLVSASVFTSDATATSAMVGIYSKMVNDVGFAGNYMGNLSFLGGLSADELNNYNNNGPNQAEFYHNNLVPT